MVSVNVMTTNFHKKKKKKNISDKLVLSLMSMKFDCCIVTNTFF